MEGSRGPVELARRPGLQALGDETLQLRWRRVVGVSRFRATGPLHGLQLGRPPGQRAGLLETTLRLERGGLAAHGAEIARGSLEGLVEGPDGLAGLVRAEVQRAHAHERQRAALREPGGLLVVSHRFSRTAPGHGHVAATQGLPIADRALIDHGCQGSRIST